MLIMNSTARKKASTVYNERDSMLYIFTMVQKRVARTTDIGDGIGVILWADDGSIVGMEIYSDVFIENREG